ncbi:hypothetical protein B0A54_08980 [Friedmanniomyces endolithicus]|uniref:VPS9 domain-containing protein n=1 Tax=Friedmanniomyces endolithicus TaxID=329885 RepID=A0A4U0UX29_9PEZI|nr:hypothetical protein LTS09_002878 [Friedmanniomyces endolithicus]TKA40523.1 hypothetical protein B0A54_08980 [Friedmanniomyces endolithicus]
MQPLNPFLRAFFRSTLPSQCSPINHHIILCPTTDILLNSRDRDSNTSYAELATTEEFLASHVLRVPGGAPPAGGGAKDGGNVRENKSKAKQYSTLNGRTVVLKDAFAYSNKGFKTLNQAQLLQDAIYYPDTPDGQQWLVYYISRPLVGSYQSTPTIPAVISDEPSKERRKLLSEASETATSTTTSPPPVPKKKDVKNFAEVLNQFPVISRQMQSGLEKIIREFVAANEKNTPKPRSRSSSLSSQHSAPSMRSSMSSVKSSLSGSSTVHPTQLELEPEEDALRTSLESTVTAAIDLFQQVDKQQLSLLGANTELTGPVVERMIERYVIEQVHDQTVFPKVCATRKPDDSDLDSKIRKMSDIDIAQVGIPIEDGMKGKRELAARLSRGVESFKKIGVASSPQEMLEILLATQKVVSEQATSNTSDSGAEKQSSALTINADILVSMLLVVVIRSGVRHLHSRLLYMRYFIFLDEVESGEQGYALATLEAVLAHLTSASSSMRKASKRNRLLWQAARGGDIQALEAILEPSIILPGEDTIAESPTAIVDESSDDSVSEADLPQGEEDAQNENRRPDFSASNGSLGHVFPFQRPPTPPPEQHDATAKKRVSMASLPRSQSASSGYSSRSHSRKRSVDSTTSNGDLSSDKLAQTQDAYGNSVLMMAVEGGQRDALKFLFSLPSHFRADFVLDDVNNAGTSLLSAAVQSDHRSLTDLLIDFLEKRASGDQLRRYLSVQDLQGRCMAHYLFNQPHLIQRFGKKLPWRLKDKHGQTPLFAVCRSYDHKQYHSMVDAALSLATATQGDGEALHLDDHVDAKGNTLLHIVVDAQMTLKLLRYCDADANAANDKRFTPLMVGSKYGRIDTVRALFGDPRVDMTLKDIRGLTAVELAKDDDVRNRIDDLVLLSTSAAKDGRTTTVVRSFFVEDATIRFVLKSGAQNDNGSITVTTCRRSISDFESLANWLSTECTASWLPSHFNLPSPFLVSSRPSRAILRDVQLRLDNFFRALLAHGTFATHELVWEVFLVPELDSVMLTERSKRKAEARVDNLKDDFEPVLMDETQEVENFVAYAKDQVRGVTQATRKVIRAVNRHRMRCNDLFDAQSLAAVKASTLLFLPQPYIVALERYTKTLMPTEASPWTSLYYNLHSVHSTSSAIQVALNRPAYLIGSMGQAQRSIDRSMSSVSRSSRWTPNIVLFEDAKRAAASEAWDKAGKARGELESLGCELRYTQQTVASELAVWQDEHVRAGRAMLRRFAKETVVKEKARLEGMKRALRETRKTRMLDAS